VADTKVVVGEGLLAETFAHLRGCGSGRRECVCYWSGAIARPGRIDRVLHPTHTATARHYEVDGAWLDETWRSLAREEREIVVQVHTHGTRAFHSETDDEFPVVSTAGFLSLVVPDFADGEVGLGGAYLARLEADGSWTGLDPTTTIEVTR
jgi:Prokaryotic homologs of the JAB domain